MSAQLFRWQYQHQASSLRIGRFVVELDSEGFITGDVPAELDERLRRNPGFQYVALNNDGLWARRVDDAKARVASAEAEAQRVERDLVRARDFLRACKEQLADVERDRAAYAAALDGDTSPGLVEPVESEDAQASVAADDEGDGDAVTHGRRRGRGGR